MKTYRLTALIIVFVVVLSACNMPSSAPTQPTANPNAVFTAAAETVVAQLTQNALLIPTNPPTATSLPPTNTLAPEVINTPPAPPTVIATAAVPVVVPTTSCDIAQFVSDVTIPDGTQVSGKSTFVKTWRLKNIGSCTWSSSYVLVFDSGNPMGGPASQPLSGSVAPGASVDISVNLQAPAADGAYRGNWGLANASGQRISISNGKTFYVDIKVGTGSADSDDGKFAVTSVNFSTDKSGSCKFVVTATISTNQAGEVTYTWIRSDGATGASMSGSKTFDAAGSKSISTEWTFSNGSQWFDLYIDKPNHQQFGRAKLVCP